MKKTPVIALNWAELCGGVHSEFLPRKTGLSLLSLTVKMNAPAVPQSVGLRVQMTGG